jgi:hypothetical protein
MSGLEVTTEVSVQDRRTAASMADVKILADSVSQIHTEVLGLLKAMLPLTAELGTEPNDLVTEFQVKLTDGRWSPADARAAIHLHQQGRPVRQRRVTAWVGVDR